jgi:hypothetical protein
VKTLFFIDIDNTLADASKRFKKAGSEPSRKDKKKYNAWVKAVQNKRSLMEDKPVPGMWAVITRLYMMHSSMEYVTSREEKWHQVTERWLRENSFPPLSINYRPNGSYTETHILKEQMIKKLVAEYEEEYGTTSVVVIDDDPSGKLSKVCKKSGWTMLKVNP